MMKNERTSLRLDKEEAAAGRAAAPTWCEAHRCDFCEHGLARAPPWQAPSLVQSGGAPLPEFNCGRPAPAIGIGLVGSDQSLAQAMQAICNGSNEFRLRGSFPAAMHALKAVAGLDIHAVLVEAALPDLCGIRCALELRIRRPGLRTVLVSDSPAPVLVARAVAVGISQCLTIPVHRSQCLATLRFATCGPGTPSPLTVSGARLTERQERVLACPAGGLEYKEIQDHLQISHSAMRRLQRSIFDELHARNGTEAVVNWLRLQSPGAI